MPNERPKPWVLPRREFMKADRQTGVQGDPSGFPCRLGPSPR